MADYNSIYTGEEIDRRLTDVDGKIALPSPAYAGLYPRGNEQGGVDWVPNGQPTDAQTAAAINAWLDAHPEATTTVQDGSLTVAKFASGVVGGAGGVASLNSGGKVPNGQLPIQTTTVTLAADEWDALAQTVSVSGVTATNIVQISAASKADADAWTACGIWCDAQGSGTLTFSCTAAPEDDVELNVLILL